MPKLSFALLLALALVGCQSDKGITVRHSPPAAVVTAPADGTAVDQGVAVAFEGLVSDDQDAAPDLQITWSSDRDGPLNTDPADGDGLTRFATASLSEGTHVITLQVINSEVRSAEDFITLVVNAVEQEPEVTLRHPRDDETGVEGVAFVFEALVRDVQDAAPDLLVVFESDLDGTICAPTADLDGLASCAATLSPGDHVVTVTVEDSAGNTASADSPFTVVAADASDDDSDGYTEVEGDCDDADPSVHPGATEYANGADDDCDGTVDDGTTNVDDDGDGYTETAGDCDDGDIDTYPGGLEVCDGVDNDCDLTVDDGTSCYDDDRDGYTETEGDCDDAGTVTYPGAAELPDGADNDCDGLLDEGTSAYDDDGDCACEVEPCTGSVEPGCATVIEGDCADADIAAGPGATELCDGADNDCDGTTDEPDAADAPTWYADADADLYGDAATATAACTAPSGYTSNATDCDDAVAATNPAGTEVCDSADNDCDGTTDEDAAVDAPTWYRDADGDAYGASATTTRACAVPSGYVASATDCNDAVATTNPGATEVCDSADNDCDSSVDEADAADAPLWYRDADSDGYGTTATSARACIAPAGYTAASTDCDDTRSAVSPSATETCNSIDDDCDGGTDEGVTTTYYRDADGDGYGLSTTSTTSCSAVVGYVTNATDCDDTDATLSPLTVWYRDSDGDSYGASASTRTQCAQPSGYVEDDTDCNDATTSAYPGRTEACDGIDNDCDGSTDEINASGCSYYYYDADGDGYGTTTSRCYCEGTGTYTASNNDDCYDSNANANPAATAYYSVNRGDGSYDYNCDSTASKRYTDNYDCTGAIFVCVDYTSGWSSSTDPACGAAGSWRTGCSADLTSCSSSGSSSRTQTCR